MESKVEYRVLAPDSVAWHIQAALVADRSGNEAARDLALCEAARVAAERRLVEPMKRYDCRTTGDRLASLEKMITSLHEHQVLDARRIGRLDIATGHADSMAEAQINALEQRLDAIEAGMASLKKVITSLHEVWMDKIERRLDVLEAHAVETDDTLSILDGRVTNDAIAGVERLQALEKRWDFLSRLGVAVGGA